MIHRMDGITEGIWKFILTGNNIVEGRGYTAKDYIRGARKRDGDIYPNRQWGYGILDMQEIFNSLVNK